MMGAVIGALDSAKTGNVSTEYLEPKSVFNVAFTFDCMRVCGVGVTESGVLESQESGRGASF